MTCDWTRDGVSCARPEGHAGAHHTDPTTAAAMEEIAATWSKSNMNMLFCPVTCGACVEPACAGARCLKWDEGARPTAPQPFVSRLIGLDSQGLTARFEVVAAPLGPQFLGALVIRDAGAAEGRRTVTNDAEAVVRQLHASMLLRKGCLFYYDSEGELAELRHDGAGQFLGYAPAPVLPKAPGRVVLWHQEQAREAERAQDWALASSHRELEHLARISECATHLEPVLVEESCLACNADQASDAQAALQACDCTITCRVCGISWTLQQFVEIRTSARAVLQQVLGGVDG